jgi:hypothetical protein
VHCPKLEDAAPHRPVALRRFPAWDSFEARLHAAVDDPSVRVEATHVTEIASSRDLVAGLIDQRDQGIRPQALVRVGLAPSIEDVPPPTPRRPVGGVLNVW